MTRKISPPTTLSPRAREIVTAARSMLEEAGPDQLTLRHLADRLGIRAPSLYNHFPDKGSLETALIASGLTELALTLEAASLASAEPGVAVAQAYRAYARRHPHLFRLMTGRPIPRELPEAMARRAFEPFVAACAGDQPRALALRAFAHGMVMLELTEAREFDEDVASAWRAGLDGMVRGLSS